ncbi:MAG: hypothetical protein WCP28_18265 [Actinomycetes bacterium]
MTTEGASVVVVNVRQLWPTARTIADQVAAAEGDWPVRSPVDLEKLRTARALVAVSRNRIVLAREISGCRQVAGDRIRFSTVEANEPLAPLVGTASPLAARWRRGENWPVKIVPVVEFLNNAPAEAEPVEPVLLGRFEIQLSGEVLTVFTPKSGEVRVVPK